MDHFDSSLSMEKHISNVVKSTNFHLRNIGSIRNVLTENATAQLVHAMITSRLDYCNSLLLGLPDSQISRLQKIQNHAARVVSRIGKYDHITPTLKLLHWLPVRQRIMFKTLLLTFKALNGKAPDYIRELLQPLDRKTSTRNTSNEHVLRVPKASKRVTFGERRFSVVAPMEWNRLPLDIRASTSVDVFKRKLKTFLFIKAYSD